MFDTVRKHQRILQFVLMLLIVPSFAFFGISSYSSFLDKETDLVKINGKPITAQEVDTAAKRQAERVGGNAQIKSMKKVSGTLKLDQALYREMEAFSKFGGDLDAATKVVIEKGARNVEVLKQPQYTPMTVEKQIAIIYLGTQGLLREISVKKIKEFEEHFLLEMANKLPQVLAEFKKGNLPEEGVHKMVELVKGLIPQYK
mgnify:CR=1 FL=1